MAQFVNEQFTGTPGDNLTAYNGWAKVSGVTGDAFIAASGDTVRFSGATLYYLGSAPAPSADYSATLTINIAASTSGPGVGLAWRLSSTAQTYYLVRLLSGTGVQMYRVVNGTSLLLGTVAYTPVVGAVLTLRGESIGSQHNAYIDGATTPSLSANDTQITAAGFVGLRAINATTHLRPDSLTADTAGSAGIDGTLSSTLDGAGMAAAGTVIATGPFASTLAGATLSATGSVGNVPSGTFASTLSGATLAAAGVVTIPGTFSSSLAGASMSATGMATNRGTFAATLDGAMLSASGSLAMNASGTLGATLNGATLSAGGYVGVPPEQAGFFQRLPKNPRHYLPLQ